MHTFSPEFTLCYLIEISWFNSCEIKYKLGRGGKREYETEGKREDWGSTGTRTERETLKLKDLKIYGFHGK